MQSQLATLEAAQQAAIEARIDMLDHLAQEEGMVAAIVYLNRIGRPACEAPWN